MIQLLVTVLVIGFQFTETRAQGLVESQKVTAPVRASLDFFGFYDVGISGNYAIVGAVGEDEDASELNTMSSSGSAYIYQKYCNGSWGIVQKLAASDRDINDYFGCSVSMSGKYALVGAKFEDHNAIGTNTLNDAGSAYIFEKDINGNWNQVQKIVASDRGVDDNFGCTVAISDSFAIVGAYLEDQDAAGANTLTDAGSAYIFEKNSSGVWVQVQKIVASDRGAYDGFGISVAIADTLVIVGAYKEDHNTLGTGFIQESGSAYIFARNGAGVWNQVQKIISNDRDSADNFGYRVKISDTLAVIGAPFDNEDEAGLNNVVDAGAAYIFKSNGSGVWSQHQKIVASQRAPDDRFGNAVDISEAKVLCGAVWEDEDEFGLNTMVSAGAAYIFEPNAANQWLQVQKLVQSNRAWGDEFGTAVGMDDGVVLVGAHLEDQDEFGGNTLSSSGSAFFFQLPCTPVSAAISPMVCGSYLSPSGNYLWTTSGNYSDTVTTACGCDSIIQINLTVSNPANALIYPTACISYQSPSANYIWTSSGTYQDTIVNGMGCDSIITIQLTINQPSFSIISASACNNYLSPSGLYNWTSSGLYQDTIANMHGCDSVIYVSLIIHSANTNVITLCNTMVSNATNATYQWLDCNNNYAIIPGETNQTYSPPVAGNYAVETTQNGCVDTSACNLITLFSINNENGLKQINLYPNPTSGLVNIGLGAEYEKINLTLTNNLGQFILNKEYSHIANIPFELIQSAGVYFIELTTPLGATAKFKVVKK